MSPTLLDTDTLSLLLRQQPTVDSRAYEYMQVQGVLQFSIITYYESLSGLLYRDARQQLRQFQQLVALHEIVPLTTESVAISARIEADLRSRGQSIGPTDTLIAGIALANNLQLATNNTRHFSRIEGLQLVNWTQ
ncbi:MAG TPA: type II toxin-antitoxin system VapC family toxin [Hymenobacter sp.]|uniref:type II toxin-antitoxin system VapC family toxin n=1 Tax=Hymenobacter sp. TaxID=1898978 RepID=UPI002D7F597A|nr:type II toxin-antitoxin system VapC family toxin [Hymenobacter sp.]HET9502538.1 type II toxin-antitoxin system VapC family toxin [Hymenobacter sp.]